jgi:hypothetical protein
MVRERFSLGIVNRPVGPLLACSALAGAVIIIERSNLPGVEAIPAFDAEPTFLMMPGQSPRPARICSAGAADEKPGKHADWLR